MFSDVSENLGSHVALNFWYILKKSPMLNKSDKSETYVHDLVLRKMPGSKFHFNEASFEDLSIPKA